MHAVRHVVIGIGEPERRDHERRAQRGERGRERVDEHLGCDGPVTGVVRVLDELEVHGRRAQDVERGVVLASGSPSRRRPARSPTARPTCASGRSGTGGFPANTVTTNAPGCAAMKLPQLKTASSRWGETIATRSETHPAGAGPTRIGSSRVIRLGFGNNDELGVVRAHGPAVPVAVDALDREAGERRATESTRRDSGTEARSP